MGSTVPRAPLAVPRPKHRNHGDTFHLLRPLHHVTLQSPKAESTRRRLRSEDAERRALASWQQAANS